MMLWLWFGAAKQARKPTVSGINIFFCDSCRCVRCGGLESNYYSNT
jgi:hypothetical protein